ncbi:calmodulin-binding transcription activator isoform X2 [Musca autumnalis]|uniref:calmodulin-binding transcription activator isoform X2 n=1 Tax=Musca autumnalis TaxID=221902 RepID=UPI003CF8D197
MQQQQQQQQPHQQQHQQLTNQSVIQQPTTTLQFQIQTQQQQPSGLLVAHTSQLQSALAPTTTQQPHQQQQQQHLTNNIIVVRGSRNEHGEIVIQNKQDIFTFLTEHHQQQQQAQQQQQHQQQLQLQQQNEKATVATLTQLPATTTVARKTSISLLTNTNGGIVGGTVLAAPSSTVGGSNGATITTNAINSTGGATTTAQILPKESNTILLQTPINASQLETVLLQSGQLKKSNSTVSSTDRPFLFKNTSRSLSTDSNRFGSVTSTSSAANGDDKGPFVLQTLKRLEKSQSILVIRNSSSSALSSSSAAAATSSSSTTSSNISSGANSTSSLAVNASSTSLANSLTVEHKLSLSSSSLSSMQQQQPQILTTTGNVNTKPNTITFTRHKKSQTKSNNNGTNNNATSGNSNNNSGNGGHHNSNSNTGGATTITTTKLGDILASAKGQPRHILTATASTNTGGNGNKATNAGGGGTTTTTYLRLTNANAGTNSNNNNSNGNSNIATIAANIVHKNHNSSRVNLNGPNVETITAAVAAGTGAGQATQQKQHQQHLNLADVQLKHERTSTTTAANAASSTMGLQKTSGSDGDPIKLPDNLESLPRADSFPSQRHRWNTNEEIAAILISFDKHNEWQSKEVKTRPKSGSLLLYSRKKVRYRRDGYCWKKRKDGKTTREDHMKLKVQGTECIYGCYVHSAILPTFHRRCYWLLQNPDIVLVHYLNVPYPDDNKMAVIAPSISLWGDKKEWTKEELVSQLKPMLSTVTSDDESDSGNDIEISTAETVESIVCQLMEKQRLSRQAALVKQLDCGCGDASCADGKTCTHPVMRRPSLIKSTNEKRLPASNSVENFAHSGNNPATPNVVVGPKLYSRWLDKRAIRDASNAMDTQNSHYPQQQQQQHHHGHGHHAPTQQLPQESAIKFQIIPPHNEQQQQQQYRQHHYTTANVGNHQQQQQQMMNNRNNLIMQQQQQQQQQMQTNQTNFNQMQVNNNNTIANNNNGVVGGGGGGSNLQRYNSASSLMQQQQQRFQIAKTTVTAMEHSGNNSNNVTANQQTAATSSTTSPASGPSSTQSLMSSSTPTSQSNSNSAAGSGGGLDVNMLSHTTNTTSSAAVGGGVSNGSNKINHNTNMNANGTTTIATATAMHQKQNDLNVINNNGPNSSSSSSSKYTTNYNQQQQQQQINSSSSNNNSMLSHVNTQQKQEQQQQQYYKLQQNNNNKQHQPQQQHQQQEQQQQPPASASSTVEPMCMSPEHQPSTITSSSAILSSPPQNSHNNNNHHTQQQHQHQQQHHKQPHLMMSSSDSISEPSTSLSSSSSSTLPSASSQNFMDVNQKSNNNNNNNIGSTTTATTTENTQMSSNNELDTSNNTNTSNNNNNNNSNTNNVNNNHSNNLTDKNNRNNQLDDYNNCTINKNPTGCAASDASNCNNSMSNQNPNPNSNQTNSNNNNDNLHSNNNNTNSNNNNSSMTNSSSIGFENLEDEQHGQQQSQPNQHQSGTTELQDTLGFFNETLDLSHEDIQRTLIANMPNENTLLNTLDFMNSNGVQNTEAVRDGPQCEPDQLSAGADADDEDTDDVFAHLDAFDMLVEFPELDLDDKQALSNTALEQAANGVTAHHMVNGGHQSTADSCHQHLQNLPIYESGSAVHQDLSCDKKFLKICDFSPDWSYPEGGVKVLVAGPWSMDCQYTVLFDSHPVPTVMVQEGVLRCYCPAHEVGFATMQVSSDGYVISDSVMFEYKMSACQEAPFDDNTNDCLYKFSLYNRLTTIEESLQTKAESIEALPASQQIFSLQGNLEEKLVSYCHQLTKLTWQSNASASGVTWNAGYKGMTLLHLAAALGYNKLVCALLTWRSENPHIILETEIDAFSQDAHGYTPLTWACSRGHLETVTLLYKWNQNALKIKNHAQQTPLDVAHLKGHKLIVSELYRLEHERQRKQSRGSLSSLSLNLNKYSLSNDESDDNPSFTVFDTTDPSQRSHDGVFLRPVAVSSNQSPPNSSRFSKRSSIDSGISMDIRSKPVKSFKDLTRLHSLDAHDNYGSSGGNMESPLDSITTPANTTNSLLSPLRKMDFALCEVSTGDASPLPDKSNDDDDTSTIDNEDCCNDVVAMPNKNIDAVVGDSDAKVLTLAEHIIAAMPERIKNEADEMMVLGSPMTEPLNSESSGLNDSFMDPLLDSLPNAHFDNEFNFDFNDHTYRYHEVSTPCSSLSPASSGPLQSPASYSILGHDPSVSSPSPPPSTKQLTEFLHASSNSQYPFEADFSKLTLTDTEQRELYEAAKCIQKAYRSYKGRQKLEEQNKERTAAIVIQNYYRRYKQFAYYRQMTNAALVIQHGYRSYCRNKRFKKSQNTSSLMASGGSALHNSDSQDSTNSQCLSSFFDNFTKQEQNADSSPQSCSTPKETSPSGPLKRTYSQSTQNQAARKIQQFMRQSRIKLQRERAEKEKLVHQRRAEYLQNLQYQGQQEIACPIEKSDTTEHHTDSNITELVNNDITNNNNHQ